MGWGDEVGWVEWGRLQGGDGAGGQGRCSGWGRGGGIGAGRLGGREGGEGQRGGGWGSK